MDDLDNITVAVKRQKLSHSRPAKPYPQRRYSPNRFDKIAVEITQNIASFLEYDQDICNFQLICKSTRDAIEENGGSFWRRRFLTDFERPNWAQADNAIFKKQYQKRRHLLKNGAVFSSGGSTRERRCLDVLAELIAESHSTKPKSSIYIHECKNMQHIDRFFHANNLLQNIGQLPRSSIVNDVSRKCKRKRSPVREPVRITPTALLQAMQIIAAPMLLSFDPHILNHHYGFPDSQRVVYSSSRTMPLLHGRERLDLNMDFILHNLNFWKYHMIREPECTLFQPFSELHIHDRPQWWSSSPAAAQTETGKNKTLATRWKGSYAYIDRVEIDDMRTGHAEALEIQDRFAGEGSAYVFQDMKLSLISEDEAAPWPAIFEQVLHARRPRSPPLGPRTRAQQRHATADETTDQRSLSFRFDGEGQDNVEAFLTSGYLNTLPVQQGIPGWQRVSMMKYFEDEFGALDREALWAYEGVLLPGGKIMVGRWWNVDADEMAGEGEDAEEDYSGPFLLWAVD